MGRWVKPKDRSATAGRPRRVVAAAAALLLLLLAAPALRLDAEEAPAPGRKAFVIPIRGTVEPSMAAFVKRAIRDTADTPGALYVLEIDTPGGRVDSALAIVETMLETPGERTVAFVRDKALSAGALIALSCGRLVMRPSSTIGDCAPITYSEKGVEVMGEKFQSPLRAKFRTLARRNGYPATLAESMVTAEMEVFRVELPGRTLFLDAREIEELPESERASLVSKQTVVAEGELLTMDDTEARELGFSAGSAADVRAALALLGAEGAQIVRLETSWSEDLGRLIGMLSPLLLMIGLAALYTELKAPGFGVPGIVGIACLALVFSVQYLVGLADYTELIIVLLGVVLLGIELFALPGFGVAGFAGLALLGVGLLLSLQDFVLPDPKLPWQKDILLGNLAQVLGAFVVAIASALAFARYVLPRLGRVVQGPYLAATLGEARAGSGGTGPVRAGDAGTAVTPLRPSGKAAFGDELVDVVTEGGYIEPGTAVVVARVQGARVVVARKP